MLARTSLFQGPRPCDKQIVRRAAKHAEVPLSTGDPSPGAPFSSNLVCTRNGGEGTIEVRADRWDGRRKRKEGERRGADRNSTRANEANVVGAENFCISSISWIEILPISLVLSSSGSSLLQSRTLLFFILFHHRRRRLPLRD